MAECETVPHNLLHFCHVNVVLALQQSGWTTCEELVVNGPGTKTAFNIDPQKPPAETRALPARLLKGLFCVEGMGV